MSIATPALGYAATLQAGTSVAQSSNYTITVVVPTAWEVQVPLKVIFSNVSADPVVSIYPSSDGGTSFDSQALTSFSITNVPTGSQSRSIKLPTGMYAIQFLASGPAAQTFMALTQQVFTGINNV